MDPAQWFVRRANVDDLAGLKILWERAGYQVLDVERHLTEFQLISSREGDLGGAVALKVVGKHGLLHSEAFTRPDKEDEFRSLLWDRIKNLARNHGIVRLWTQEQAPFWHHECGFADADPEALKSIPPSFGDPRRRWLMLALREDLAGAMSLEQEFEVFQQASRANMEEMLGQARHMRRLAYIVGGILLLGALGLGGWAIFRWIRENGGKPPRRL
jgi:N-acetylglutamate synthase-like GNAT family acetyltransferase